MKKFINLTSILFLIAYIKSSELKTFHTRYGMPYLSLCANFDIQQEVSPFSTISSSSQCGQDWDSIIKGIREQLKEKQNEINEDRSSKDEKIRLESIKNDKVGYTIK